LYENAKPILADKIFYYRDPAFTPRLLAPPPVRRLDLALHLARVQGRVRPATEKDLQQGPAAYVARLAHNLEGLPRVHKAMSTSEQSGLVSEFLDRLEPMEPAPAKRVAPRPSTVGGDAQRQISFFASEGSAAQLAISR
jgi:hypothetical protein